VVVDAGETERTRGEDAMPDWVKPSDIVIDHGAVPVRATDTEEDPPSHTVPPPLTVAAGCAFTVTAMAEAVPTQPRESVTVGV
jgi:hypothetical protein